MGSSSRTKSRTSDTSKKSHKDRHHHRDRDRDREREKDRDRDRDKEKDRSKKIEKVIKVEKIESERSEKSKKILQEEKNKAALKAQLLNEAELGFNFSEEIPKKKRKLTYTEKDLAGLRVAHAEKYFQEGQQVILTLQDKDVLDESDDVLENVNIVDLEKAEKNIDNKLKKSDYKPYDQPEFDEFGILIQKSILSKYDEEISGPKKSSFVLGNSEINRDQELEMIRERLKQKQGEITLMTPNLKVASEYYTEEEMLKFKKPKKIKKKLRTKAAVKNEADLLATIEEGSQDHGSRSKPSTSSVKMETENTTFVKPVIKVEVEDNTNDNEEDYDFHDYSGTVLEEEQEAEEEFRKALAKARKFREKETTNSNDVISQIIKEREATIKQEKEDDYESDNINLVKPNIILNSTAEFCRNLGDLSTFKAEEENDEDELMDFEKELGEERQRQNELSEETAESIRGKWNEVDLDAEKHNEETNIIDPGQPILEEEPDVSVGLAGALQLAMKKGYLDKETKRPVGGSRHSSLLQAQNYAIEEKFYEDDKIGRRERYSGPVSEFKEKEGYKPDVKLEYVDEKGRILNRKEAFRVLSHKFHGKGPGKNKIDKRVKKLEQDSKLRQMNSTDTPLGTLKLLQEKQKELHSAYVVLSGASTSLTKN